MREKGVGGAINYISNRDGVTMFADPIRRFGANIKSRSDVVFLPSRGIPMLDHFYKGDTYNEGKRLIYRNIKTRLGIDYE